MARSLNTCSFIGHVGRDPEIKHLPNGTQIANFSLAVSDSYLNKSGEKVEETEWVRCTAFNKLAEIIGQYVRKGSKLYVEGRMKTRSYEKEGQTHYATDINANNIQMLDSKQAQAPQQQGGYQQPQYQPQQQQPQQQPQHPPNSTHNSQQPQQQYDAQQPPASSYVDDIPF